MKAKGFVLVSFVFLSGLLLATSATNVFALGKSPPKVDTLNYSFDNNSDPRVLTITGTATGGSETKFCTVEQDTQRTFEYGLSSVNYSIAGTSLSGGIDADASQNGQDGNCVAVGDGGAIPYKYDFRPTAVDISSLPNGIYTLRVTVVDDKGQQSSKSVDFTINRTTPPPPQTGTILVYSNLPTSWNITGPNSASYSGTGQTSGNTPAGLYPDVPTGDYSITADDVSGKTKAISPSSGTLAKDETLSFSITYMSGGGPPPGGGNNIPDGVHQGINNSSTWGWARDPDGGNPIKVRIYDGEAGNGGNQLDEITADNGSNNKDFSYTLPASVKDGSTHNIYAYAKDAQTGDWYALNNTPRTIGGGQRYSCSGSACVLDPDGPYSSSNCNNACIIIPPQPTCTLGANPERVIFSPNSGTTLTWSCQDVASCSIDQGVGSVSPPSGGSKSVPISTTTTYTISCSGAGGGAATASAAVTVRVFKFEGGALKEITPQ